MSTLTRAQYRATVLSLGNGQNWRCFYCLCDLMTGSYHLEHRTPRCRGGSDERANLALSCAKCNWHKGVMTESEFRTCVLPYLSQLQPGERYCAGPNHEGSRCVPADQWPSHPKAFWCLACRRQYDRWYHQEHRDERNLARKERRQQAALHAASTSTAA